MNSIEPLEPRIAPAVVAAVTAGVLHVDHTAVSMADMLKIFESEPGKFDVTDNGNPVGTFPNVKSIAVALGETIDTVTVQLSSDGLPGFLNIDTGDGATNSVQIFQTTSFGRIGGNVRVTGGAGMDSVNVGGVAIKGSLTFTGEGQTDSVSGDDFFVSKTVVIDNVEHTTFDPINPVVFGALDIDQDEAASAVVFILNHVVTVKGKLTYCGSAVQDDNVTVVGTVGGPALLMLDAGTNTVKVAGRFNSTLTITGKGGNDAITFTDAQTALNDPMLIPNQIGYQNKAVKISLGDGTNSLTLERTSHFNDALSLTTGDGDDTVNFTDFFVQKGLTLTLGLGTNAVKHISGTHGIGGALKYTGGGGNDTVDLAGVVADTLSIKLGDGTNAVNNVALIVGKGVAITGGVGVDTLNFGIDSNEAILTVALGAGVDSLTFTSGALAGAKLDGGGDADTLVGESKLPVGSMILGFETKMP